MFSKAQLELLEIAVRAGLVPQDMKWSDAIPKVEDFFKNLLETIELGKDLDK